MSVETLRKAANLMRANASNAGLSPWHVEGKKVCNRNVYAKTTHEHTAQHIASWHPAVALAVADWLDNFAEHGEAGDYGPDEWDHALTVARTYLGETA